MRWWLLVTIALSGAACATTTVGPDPVAPRPLAEGTPSDVSLDAPDAPRVEVLASSPTAVEFRAGAGDVAIPLGPPRWVIHQRRRARVMDGMWIGAGVGVLGGALSGHEQDQDAAAHPDAHCDPFVCGGQALLGSVVFAAIGLGLGAAVGAIVGRLENP